MKHVNRFSTSLLWLSLTMMPSFALAQGVIIDGCKTQQNIPIPAGGGGGGGWTRLCSTVVPLGGAAYDCEVTCTSTVNNPQSMAADQDYYYAAFNAPPPALTDGCVRPFDFKQSDGGVDEIEHLVVASTCYIPDLTGQQTFQCLMQAAVAQLATTVDNTSMHVICVPDQ